MTRAAAILLPVAGVALVGACEPYRIEYRTRPAYYQRLVDEPLPQREVLEDGTVVVYRTVDLPDPGALSADGGKAKADGRKYFRSWDEQDDGSVVLRALMPEHVLINTLNCLRMDDYEPLWDQMLATTTKASYTAEGQGLEAFSAFMHDNRVDLAKMLNRMRVGIGTNETVVENAGNGMLVCRFWPQTAKLFKFKKVFLVREDTGLKLAMIR